MARYILKRLVLMIPVLLGVSFIIFSIMEISPGDPVRLILGKEATPEAIEKMTEELGLNENFFVKYFKYVGGVVRGDFGTSYVKKTKVFDEIKIRIPITFTLASVAIIIMIVTSIPLGIISATKQYSFIDNVCMILALIGASLPPFWFGLLLIMFFSVKLGLLPSFGVESLASYILPAITLCVFNASILIRYTRSTMLDNIRQDYITTVRSKGASERLIIGKHALRNAMIPIMTVIGSRFAAFIGGAVIVETVFSMPGLGTLLITGIRMKDQPIVLGTVIFLASVFSFINLIVDILYAFVDPRVKSQYSR